MDRIVSQKKGASVLITPSQNKAEEIQEEAEIIQMIAEKYRKKKLPVY